MRDYAKIAPTFWTRGSGKALRGDRDAQLVALYVMTCSSANMVGLYYLPIPTLAHEVGLTSEEASEALRRVSKAGIAHYDEASELVWVPRMAARQVAESLKPKDNQRKAVLREVDSIGKHRFVADFYRIYSGPYELSIPAWVRGLSTPSEAPSDPLRSQDQDQDQDQEQYPPKAPQEGGEGVLPKVAHSEPPEDSAPSQPEAADVPSVRGSLARNWGSVEQLVAAYAAGIESATGASYITDGWAPTVQRRLAAFIDRAAPANLPFVEVLAWTRQTAKEYASDRSENPSFEQGYSPKKFSEWWNGRRAVMRAPSRTPSEKPAPAPSAPPTEAERREALAAAEAAREAVARIGSVFPASGVVPAAPRAEPDEERADAG